MSLNERVFMGIYSALGLSAAILLGWLVGSLANSAFWALITVVLVILIAQAFYRVAYRHYARLA